jgi:NAD(P)-dependent dehydrogenase (short-subunit alcohol dehydrogenase family)
MTEPKHILLTGASAGIGEATAKTLLARGHRVWGTSRSTERLKQIDGLHPLELDLVDPSSIAIAMAQGMEQSGGFDVVINNAGNGIWGPVEALGEDEVRRQFQVLVFGPMQVIRGTLPAMRARGGGLIINVTSLAAEFAVPFLGSYSAAKAAMSSLSWALQMELQGQPIHVVDLRPGDICSEFHKKMTFSQNALPEYQENLDRALAVYNNNMQKAPAPERVAERVGALVDSRPGRYRTVAVGGVFQASIAPFLSRFASTALLRWSTSRYFNLRSGRN